MTYHHVDVQIDNQVATTSVDEEFYNPNPQRLEGTYIFPLPTGSHVDNFSMDIDGKMQSAELLTADKARALYEQIVRQMKDPALLEYAGRDALQVHIFPIEPNSSKHVKLKYTQLLTTDSGMTEYSYPLNTEKFSSTPLHDVSVKVTLNCKDPIKSIYSPSHNIDITHDGDSRATAGFEAKDIRPDTDFKLIYSCKQSPIGINLLTYKLGSDDGYFMVMASPGADSSAKSTDSIPKDICFVLDTSGSMAGPKLDQAKKALEFCLANLNPTDRFELVRFSTEPEHLFSAFVPATSENIAKARDFVQQLQANGGTAIDDALKTTLQLRRDKLTHDRYSKEMADEDARPFDIIFLTDGMPTVGETSEDAIVANASSAAESRKARIFCFGLGTDVNTHLLDRIADQTHAASQYVLPEEDIEIKVSNFYAKIKEPALTDVALSVTGFNVHISQLYPNTMPDLFKGQMLVAFGRYTGDGPAAIKLIGTQNGQTKTFAQDATFTAEDIKNSFIPRLWASRRVGWLLDEIRLHGESQELKDEVVRLARQHGIVTPYTAYLIMEDEKGRNVPLSMQTYRELSTDSLVADRTKMFYQSAPAEAASESSRTGAQAVANATNVGQLKDSFNMQQATLSSAMSKAGGSGIAGGGGYSRHDQLRPASPRSKRPLLLPKRLHLDRRNRPITKQPQTKTNLFQQRRILRAPETIPASRPMALPRQPGRCCPGRHAVRSTLSPTDLSDISTIPSNR